MIVQRLGLPLPKTWVGRSLLEPGLKDYSLHQAGRGRSLCRAIVKPMSDKLWKSMRCFAEAAGVSEERAWPGGPTRHVTFTLTRGRPGRQSRYLSIAPRARGLEQE